MNSNTSLPVNFALFLARVYGCLPSDRENFNVEIQCVEPGATITRASGAYHVFGSGDAWASVEILAGAVTRSEKRDRGDNGFVGYYERDYTLPQGSVLVCTEGATPGPDSTSVIFAGTQEELDALVEEGRRWAWEHGDFEELRQELCGLESHKLPCGAYCAPGMQERLYHHHEWSHLPERAWLALLTWSEKTERVIEDLRSSAPRFCDCGVALDPEERKWECSKCEAHREAQLRKEAAELAAWEEAQAIAEAMAVQRQLVRHGSHRRARALRREHY